MSTRDEILFGLKLAQQLNRYDDMTSYVRQLAQIGGDEISPHERKLILQAYKNVLSPIQTSVKFLKDIEAREDHKSQQVGGNPRLLEVMRSYKQKLESDISTYCKSFVQLIETNLLPNTQIQESKAFYLKACGDFKRYIIENLQQNEQRQQLSESAMAQYEEASKIALHDLKPTHPTRLSVALNFSVFLYEALGDVQEAVNVSREAFDHGVNELETVDEEYYKQSSDLLTLLRDNLNEWTIELENIEFEERLEVQ